LDLILDIADSLHPPASASKLATTDVNRDTLLTVGWLDLNKGPQILHVPEMAGRYYSVQFTDPSKNTNFAYVEGSHAAGQADFFAAQFGADYRARAG